MNKDIHRSKFLVRSCYHKKKYKYKEQATGAVFTLRVKEGKVFRAYHCSNCNGWHITREDK